ncbi:hypothetical protein DOTSEDRAFT_74627 [Dothistroma septosporum NZE10]|uniref:C-CAP/cofactor C-like domain-containing protein n=1 Tax=Dothistroma septosporum (strain NZE10 / CBS 128990) TaxID=675120 RepID=N1PC75_DOTSN|nr:hypothetical protein DOTSEDRAFT_74627 [Dothistroma septosporum NZE10]
MAAATAEDLVPAVQLPANEKFFRYFQQEVTDLQEQMARIENHGASGGERSDAVDHVRSVIARLSGEVQDASSYIPAYDQRTYGEAIKALNNKLQEVKMANAPRQKFSFKNRQLFSAVKNESAISLSDAAELAKQKRNHIPGFLADLSNTSSYVNTPASNTRTPANEKEDDELATHDSRPEVATSSSNGHLTAAPAGVRTLSFSGNNAVFIHSHDNVHIMLPSAASDTTGSGTVSDLDRCVVDMSTPATTGKPFAGLTLKNITSSLVICGHVGGAAHLTNIKDSVIVVATRQFRMHESSNCDVYLLATSRPIIEDCSAIRFAPMPHTYTTEEDKDIDNKWSNVDDFKWLRNEQSPHWSPLDPSKRVAEKVWKDVVPGGHDLSIENILDAVNVPK